MLSRKKIAVLALAVIAGATIIVTQTASSKGRAYKLEGAWTFQDLTFPGALGCVTLAPSDPSGQAAAFRVNWPGGSPDFAPTMAYYGVDSMTDFIGEARMLSRKTARCCWVAYWIKTGVPNEIKMILIGSNDITFTSQDTGVSQATWAGYLPTTDANGDGLPDSLENPQFAVSADGLLTRVPMWP